MVANGSDEGGAVPGERPHVPPAKLHSIKDLSEIDSNTVAQLRTLQGYQRYAYLFELTDVMLHPHLDAFLRDKIEAPDESPASPQGLLLVPELPLAVLLRQPMGTILASLGPPESRLLQIEVNPARWRSGFEYGGSPAVLREDLGYDWQPPEEITAIRAGAVATWKVEDVRVAVRRWLASRIAFVAVEQDVELSGGAPALLAAARVSVAEASPDALRAVAALAVEGRLGADDRVPGFRAHDTVYLD